MDCAYPITEPEHPILVDLILENVFKKQEFNMEDFKNYSLVCRKRWKVSLLIWRKKDLPNNRTRQFWEVVGKTMTDMVLDQYPFHDVEAFRQILFILTPKLEYLVLKRNIYHAARPASGLEPLDPRRKAHMMLDIVRNNL
ncbi:unnamed protein product [Orchesella dallaii]|uniref:Uncharacterized protein n=1 Tax=Orchesella dallaii TaxID=48710 RepID=A0ABP1R5E4_9HEXA